MNLERLTWLGEAVVNAPPKLFDMYTWDRPGDCGTVHCAAGWLCVDPRANALGLHLISLPGLSDVKRPSFRNLIYYEALAEFLEVPVATARHLLCPAAYEAPYRDLSPIHKSIVLRRIDAVIASGEEKVS